MRRWLQRTQPVAVLCPEGGRLVLHDDSGLALTELMIGSEHGGEGGVESSSHDERRRHRHRKERSAVRQKDRAWLGACAG